MDKPNSIAPEQSFLPVVEFRKYNLHPGRRDDLVALFEQEFIESQESLGMVIIGQFYDASNPDLFVWLRGFPSASERAEALAAFYGGPVWMTHRDFANATMADYSDVLLLRPAGLASGFALGEVSRPPPASTVPAKGLVVATTCHFDTEVNPHFVDFFERTLVPTMTECGASVLGSFVSDTSANTFPALPVREDEHVLVWFSLFEDEEAYQCYFAAFVESALYRDGIWDSWRSRFKKPPEIQRLLPTPRSLLHG